MNVIRNKQLLCKNPCCKNCLISEMRRSQAGEKHYLCRKDNKLHKGKDFCKHYSCRCK